MSGSNEQALREQLALVGRAVGQPHRLRLLELLAQKPYRVEQLAEIAGLSMASASQHLQQLRHAGLVTVRRDGRQMIYALTDERIIDLLALIREIAQGQLAEVERLLGGLFATGGDGEPTETISAEALLERLDRGEVVLLDVRPEAEFSAGHLPHAQHSDPGNLDTLASELPKDRLIVAYCRGPYCTLSHRAAQDLAARGFHVRRLDSGFPEWKRAGYPVEHSRAVIRH